MCIRKMPGDTFCLKSSGDGGTFCLLGGYYQACICVIRTLSASASVYVVHMQSGSEPLRKILERSEEKNERK